jgi:chitinase
MAKSPAGQFLDLINIMAYDAGNLGSTGFDPLESFNSQRAVWPNAAIALGVEVPPEAWGGNVVSLSDVQAYSQYVKNNGGRGMMIWSLQKRGEPSANSISHQICQAYNMEECQVTLPF